MTYEYYSSLALVSSVVVYALAMFAHTAEWAAARRLGVARPAERELVDVAAAEARPESSHVGSQPSRTDPAKTPETSSMRPEPSEMRPDFVEGLDQASNRRV